MKMISCLLFLTFFAVVDGQSPTKKISYWGGKVNQYFDAGVWKSDPDKTSGATINKLTYCKKWYPSTTSVRDTGKQETLKFCAARQTTCSHSATMDVFECVQPKKRDGNWCSSNIQCSSGTCRGSNCCGSKGRYGCTDCDYSGHCSTCSANYYKSNSQCYACSSGKTSPSGSTSWSSCASNSCAPTQVSNSNKAATRSITGKSVIYILFFFVQSTNAYCYCYCY